MFVQESHNKVANETDRLKTDWEGEVILSHMTSCGDLFPPRHALFFDNHTPCSGLSRLYHGHLRIIKI